VYNDRIRELSGEEYEQTEDESWAELQTELTRLDSARRTLDQAAD
jgi:hypothetical protein